MATAFAIMPAQAGLGAGVGNVPQGTQGNNYYRQSYAKYGVTNVLATTQRTSCYRPEAPFFTVGTDPSGNVYDGYSGMQACPGANTGEDIGLAQYPTQQGSRPGYPALGPMLVNDHSESDLRVDPKNPSHLIGSSKWFASAEGYNHLLGFYESWDGGKTWPVQGHIPGYEGFTDNTDPVGAFDPWGNFYSLLLPYEFVYDKSGGHAYNNGSNQANPAQPPAAISVAVHPAGSSNARAWITAPNGHPDFVATAKTDHANTPDKQWVAIDTT